MKQSDRKEVKEGLTEYEEGIGGPMSRAVRFARGRMALLLKMDPDFSHVSEKLETVEPETPLDQLISLVNLVNIWAKRVPDCPRATLLYRIKDALLDLALYKANKELPESYWGVADDDNRATVLYFDLPGIGQISFHRPNFVAARYPFRIPLYKYDWVGQGAIDPKVMHPAHALINVRGGTYKASRNDAMAMRGHPLFEQYRRLLQKYRNKLPPEIGDLAVA